jgi:peptidoglycan-associated lipoprotein
MKTILKISAVIMAGVLLTACASSKKPGAGGAGVEDRNGAAGTGAGAGGAFGDRPWEDPSNPLSRRVIYFEYDSSEVRAEDREVLATHASYLSTNTGINATLEGHADERGSREYNIALGERRAEAVRSLMEVQGVSGGQLRSVSYGEEKPAVPGSDESALQQNRRVEIVYQPQ